tara:strand:+ start:42 stop:914 length:873 start_codon:yes stop_codon:yes gene_type:complete
MKKLKTPLRYPGGKSRVAAHLLKWIPKDITEYREPFLGGGSMAIEFTKQFPDVPVWVNDKYEYLYNFWVQLQKNGEDLSDVLQAIKLENSTEDKARELFNAAKTEIGKADSFRQAVLFWVLNKCSYSGLTENSAFSASASRQNFTVRGAKALAEYSDMIQHWHITNIDYELVMNRELSKRNNDSQSIPCGNVFLFLDPPYMINSYLYGTDAELHKGFDHEKFADDCKVCPHRWMITYNVKDEISELFEGFHQRNFKITYGMQHRRDNRKQELLITNYDVEPPTPIDLLYA